MDVVHTPVLTEQVLEYLAPKGEALLIDGTVGEGGHSERFLESCSEVTVVGVDTDEVMLDRARERLAGYGGRFSGYHEWFDKFFASYPLSRRPDRILLDLGISMFHYRASERGFSFSGEEPLDMRLRAEGRTAADIIREARESELADMIYLYGEERLSRRIASAIVREREVRPIRTTAELESVIWKAVPASYRRGRIHPATRTFQALRIAVNGELDRLRRVLPLALDQLVPGGRLGVISFHSLEDRIVKHFFRERASKDMKYRPMDKTGDDMHSYKLLTKKPVTATEEEVSANPASRSARLRVIEKLNVEMNA